MMYRLMSLSILTALVLSACAEMDDTVQTDQVVSAVVVEPMTGEEFVVELAYNDGVSYEEAVVLANDIAVFHDSGLSLAGEDATVLGNATGILYRDVSLSDLSQHVFQVQIYSETVDLSQLIDEYRWEWVRTDIVEFIKYCPPGHGG